MISEPSLVVLLPEVEEKPEERAASMREEPAEEKKAVSA